MPNELPAPLDDITVVEIDNWMAAPSAGAVLADLGATVIKIEPLAGDPMRGLGRPAKVEGTMAGHDAWFDVDNRGKRSIAVALDTDEGQAVVHRLCESADVFMCNLLPHRQEKFGLDAPTLQATNARLTHATFTGYGTDGPDAWRPGYDVTAFFGRSGLYDSMREGDDGIVPNARPAQGDHTAGLALVSAILAGLRLAERTGQGQVVETSLYESAVWTLASDLSVTAVDHAPVRRRQRDEMIVITANRFPCGDGRWVVFNMTEGHAWPRFCAALEVAHLVDDERFATVRDRFRNMRQLVDLIDDALAARPRHDWAPIFDDHGLIWGPVLALDEVVDDPQAEAIGLFPTISHPVRGDYRSVRIPMRLRGTNVGPRGPAPTVGQHTVDVLVGAGFERSEIDAMAAAGVIGTDS